tara:strand:- start:918 stop:1325 length:408 start_codon:yes stop_codon:yes gene_type:complete
MAKLKSKDWFVKKAKLIHGDKYDYSLSEYKGTACKVTIICKKHGNFNQEVGSHFKGSGCPECSFEKLSVNRRDTKEDFIEKAKKVHGNRYIYSEVNYKKSVNKVIIICHLHGKFSQEAASHLKGSGCRKCNTTTK